MLKQISRILSLVKPIPEEWTADVKPNDVESTPLELKKLDPLPCSSWKELIEVWQQAMPGTWTDDLDITLSTMLATAASTMLLEEQVWLRLISKAGCLHRDTLIYDPVEESTLTVNERWRQGKDFHVWAKAEDGSLVITKAEAPREFPKVPLYKVEFESGRSIIVTSQHRFWNGSAFCTLRSICDEMRESGPYPLLSISDSDLSNQRQGVLHWLQTVEDYRDGYLFHPRRYDGLLPSVLGSVQFSSPLPNGSHVHSRGLLQKGVLASKYRYTYGNSSYHSSKQDFCCLGSNGVGGESQNQVQPSTFGLSYEQTPFALKSLLEKFQSHKGLPLPAYVPQTKLACDSPDFAESENSISIAEYAPKDRICKVSFHSIDNYFDFHVPTYENYWAVGFIHHNTAKSTLCEALSVSMYTHAMGMFTGLHSGMVNDKGEDTSLIPRINTRTMIINEGDMLLKCPQKDQFNAQLRDLYTGVARCHYRNGKEITYGGLRTTVILAGTPVMRELNKSALGDRFLDVIVFTETDAHKTRKLVLTVLAKKRKNMLVQSNCDARSQGNPEMVRAFQMTGGYLNWLRENGIKQLAQVEAQMAPQMDMEFESLGQLTAWMRTRPHGGDEDKTEAELHIRLGAQLQKLAMCEAVTMNRTVDGEIMRRVSKIAKDTCFGTTFNVCLLLAREPRLCDTQIRNRLGTGLEHLRKSLNTLMELGCIRTSQSEKGIGPFGAKKSLYRLSLPMTGLLNKLNNLLGA